MAGRMQRRSDEGWESRRECETYKRLEKRERSAEGSAQHPGGHRLARTVGEVDRKLLVEGEGPVTRRCRAGRPPSQTYPIW